MASTDPRVIRSKQALRDAMRELLQERPYKDITGIVVAERALLGQATLYRHYKNLDDLLLDVFSTDAQDLAAAMLAQNTILDEAITLYTYVRENQICTRLFMELPPDHEARRMITELFHQLVHARYSQREASSVPYDLSTLHLVESVNRLIGWYLDHIDKYTPEEVAQMHIDLIIMPTVSATLDLRGEWLKHHAVRSHAK